MARRFPREKPGRVELALQRGLDVDLGQDAESLLLEGRCDALERLLEADPHQVSLERSGHVVSPFVVVGGIAERSSARTLRLRQIA
jgi:hypothetical protein